MPEIKKSIRFSNHARIQLGYRGANETEVIDAILSSPWKPAELGKLECRKDFIFNQIWNGKSYKTRQVRPIFTEEEKEIVVITVYVYYY